jgi:hypothetical protein
MLSKGSRLARTVPENTTGSCALHMSSVGFMVTSGSEIGHHSSRKHCQVLQTEYMNIGGVYGHLRVRDWPPQFPETPPGSADRVQYTVPALSVPVLNSNSAAVKGGFPVRTKFAGLNPSRLAPKIVRIPYRPFASGILIPILLRIRERIGIK